MLIDLLQSVTRFKLRQVLHSAMDLPYNLRQVLQSAMIIRTMIANVHAYYYTIKF